MTCLTIPEDGSLIRVFHAVPNAAAVDVYVNDDLVFSNVSFKQFTDYVPLAEGTYTIRLYATGTTSPELLSSELTVPLGGIFTAAATGNVNDLQLVLLEDFDTENFVSRESKFRVVALAPNAPALNLEMNGMQIIEGINFREMTAYAQVPANFYIMSVFNALTNGMVLNFRIQLKENQISTIYILGDLPSLGVLQSIDGSSYLCNA